MRLSFLFLLILSVLFTACGESPRAGAEAPEPLSEVDSSAYGQQGGKIAQATFAELSGHLSEALAEGGVPNALQYCNLMAYPLVDSLSQVHQAAIRRTSLRVRNPENAPTARERAILDYYQERAAAGAQLLPRVERLDAGQIAFYAPVVVQPLCLNCHGRVGQELREEDYSLIRQLYPDDEATGYQAGDLRGIWSITFRDTK